MALTDDQRALLRLLAQREEGYEDIAALMGLSVEEVRTRVRGALSALEEQSSAPASPPPASEPAPQPAPAPPPAPQEPTAAPSAPSPPPTPAASTSKRSSLPKLRLPSDRRRLAEIAGGVVVAIVVVLFAVGVIDIGGGDSGDSDSDGGSGQAAQGQSTSSPGEQEPTRAALTGVGGNADAKGVALFGRSGNNVVLVFGAEGLDPSPQGSSYAISLVKSPIEKIPIAASEANGKGEAGGQYRIAPDILGLLANGYDRMEVSLVVNKVLRSALKQAQQSEAAPEYGGEPALRGPVAGPIVEFEGDAEAE